MTAWQPIADEVAKLLEPVSTATIASQLLSRGLRDQFITGVSPVTRDRRMIGTAWTVRTIPSREDLDGLWPGSRPKPGLSLFKVIESTPAGAVLVIDGRGENRTATGGDIVVERLRARGARVLVTDAGVRDASAVSAVDLPCYSAGATANVSRAFLRIVEQDVPIGCGSVAVFPGDVLVGDDDGVVVIPAELAEEVARDASAQEELEEFIGGKVRAGAPLDGVYPPAEQLLAEFRESAR